MLRLHWLRSGLKTIQKVIRIVRQGREIATRIRIIYRHEISHEVPHHCLCILVRILPTVQVRQQGYRQLLDHLTILSGYSDIHLQHAPHLCQLLLAHAQSHQAC